MAQAFRRAQEVNKQNPSSPEVFPRTSLAARAASIAPAPAPEGTLAPFVASAQPQPSWFVGFPPNLLMVPFGQSTAAIADVLDITFDDTSSTVTMQLDVVHSPNTFSQFIPGHTAHAKDTAAAHYHFATRPGMTLDAAHVLNTFKESKYTPDGEPAGDICNSIVMPIAAAAGVGERNTLQRQ